MKMLFSDNDSFSKTKLRCFTKKESICCPSVIDKTEILTFYSRHFIELNIISFAKSLLVMHHNIIYLRFCKTGYASLFGVGLHNIELNIAIYHPQSSKYNYLLALADFDAALLLNDVIV